ncbi:serine/threonine-protein kinase LMTK1-like [Uloborus diversus]|uniref:serine/threonine-protein kinase LMTK1-like n=1 Tax=Uloborus diversus TaxID=327109 RepID=UPI00240987CE|nr:serine/threonine-protein kinase LMTK1-like [Uloborus diversus]
MPVDEEGTVDHSVTLTAVTVLGLAGVIVIFLGCMWCRNKWKKLTQRHYRLSGSVHESSVPPVQNLTEFAIFPPPACNQFTLPTGFSTDEVVFEPLPEIRSRALESAAENIRPARFTGSYGKVSLQDWFDEHQVNFPRNQLKYFREAGIAWYGQAVEGEAYNVLLSEEKTKVVVKILRVDATATEHMQYLQETRPFRDLNHPNILHLLGRCLEVHPFLLVMEHCDMDLKTYLIEQRKSPETLLKNGLLLRMACNIAAALQHMHEHGFIHTDIAAHSCLITSDLVVKVGDYGTAVHLHREDFYCLGDVAFPIRWCAPESLLCTESIIEAKDITREGNIWSFGVLLWELLEFSKLPYFSLSDDEVIRKVLIECSLKLEQPKTPCVHKDMIYKIVQLCWLPSNLRPTIQKVSSLLNYLYDNRDVVSESTVFESRWNNMQPVLREHNLQNVPPNVSLRFESDFMPRKELDCDSTVSSSDLETARHGDKSPSSGSFSMGYEAGLTTDISPSLLNLRGSMEDLISSTGNSTPEGGQTSSLSTSEQLSLETIPAENEIADPDAIECCINKAIEDLDTILADELTSSDTSKCNTPEKVPSETRGNYLESLKLNGLNREKDASDGPYLEHHSVDIENFESEISSRATELCRKNPTAVSPVCLAIEADSD